MTPKRFMLIAGESSGDVLAAELVKELRAGLMRHFTYTSDHQPLEADLAPRFFGAGGPRMAEAGVELAIDLTQHSITGLPTPGEYLKFRRILNSLFALARDREPHAIICVDFNLFNAVFAAKIKKYLGSRRGTFCNWQPKIIKYISPQVWAWRGGRAYQIARDFDLLLSIFPIEKDWYAKRVPNLPVEFIGHPMIDRYASITPPVRAPVLDAANPPTLILLPGSRRGELRRHLPVILGALRIIQTSVTNLRAQMILPSTELVEFTRTFNPPASLEIQTGGLAEKLPSADLAIASTGTITMECAYFSVPAVTLYKLPWIQFEVAKRLATVDSMTMTNILAGERVFPEFIQNAATPQNIAAAALDLLRDPSRRQKIQTQLQNIITSLGGPGASRRAAEAILRTVSLQTL